MTLEQFQKAIKAERLKGGWYYYDDYVDGKRVQLKGYKTWLQIYRVDGVNYSNCCDVSVKQFNADLALPFKE